MCKYMYKIMCSIGTACPGVVARDVKEKSHEISAQNVFALNSYCEKCFKGGPN